MRHKYEFEKYGERSLRVLWEWAINFSLWWIESDPTWVKDESHVSVMRSYRGEGCPGARGHLDQTHLPTTTSSYSPPLPSSLTNPEHPHQQKITKNSASFSFICSTHLPLSCLPTWLAWQLSQVWLGFQHGLVPICEISCVDFSRYFPIKDFARTRFCPNSSFS